MKTRTTAILMGLCLMTTTTFASLAGKRIGIDPGHGGKDPGTHSSSTGADRLYERDVALSIGLAAKKYLERDGALVTMTRTDRGLKSLAKKVRKLNSAGVERVVSIHLNWSPSPQTNRTMGLVYCGHCERSSSTLAVDVVDELAQSTGLDKSAGAAHQCDRAKYGGVKCPDKAGVGQSSLYVLRRTNMPAMLAEVSFMSNMAEEQRLKESDYIDKQGYAIYAGITRDLGKTALKRDGVSTPSDACEATKLALNKTQEGHYTATCKAKHRYQRFAKYYTFTIDKLQKVTMTLDASDPTDAYLFLMHENGNMIIEDDDSAGRHDAQIVRFLPAGTYLLEATTYNKQKEGDFTILVK